MVRVIFRARFALLAACAVLAGGTLAGAQGQTLTDDLRVDVYLQDADLIAATRMLTQRTGLQFVIAPSSEPYGKITQIRLDQATPEDAIKYICQAAGAFYRRDENGVYIISKNKPAEEQKAVLPVSQPKKVGKKILLMKADARDVLNQIKYGTPPDPFYQFDVLEDMRQRALGNSYARRSQQPRTGFFPQGPQPVGQQSFNMPRTGKEAGNDIVLPGESANQFVPGGGGQGGLQTIPQPSLGTFGQFPQDTGGSQGFTSPQGVGFQPGQGLVGGSIDFVSYDPTDNSLVVRGSEEDIAELQKWISFFDVAPRQVEVKLEFVALSQSVSKSLGYDVLFQRGTVFLGQSFARASDPIFLSYATGNFVLRLRTLLSEGFGRNVSAPVLRTMNNQQAFIQSTNNIVIFLTNTVVSPGGQTVNTSNPLLLPISTGLQIWPRINGDGTITMGINQQQTELGQIRRNPSNGTEIPDFLTQQIQVVARVRNNETIVLGGLNRKTTAESFSRYPILSDLPIIGQFFRGRSSSVDNAETLMFITARIIEEDESTSLGPQ